MTRIELRRVRTVPATLEPGVLYVSEEFETAAHLCACGCSSKVRTPLGPTEWQFHDDAEGPTLAPSVGNWQRPCKSHYWIDRGRIEWSTQWSEAQIAADRAKEQRRREIYYGALYPDRWWMRAWRWCRSCLSR